MMDKNTFYKLDITSVPKKLMLESATGEVKSLDYSFLNAPKKKVKKWQPTDENVKKMNKEVYKNAGRPKLTEPTQSQMNKKKASEELTNKRKEQVSRYIDSTLPMPYKRKAKVSAGRSKHKSVESKREIVQMPTRTPGRMSLKKMIKNIPSRSPKIRKDAIKNLTKQYKDRQKLVETSKKLKMKYKLNKESKMKKMLEGQKKDE